MTDFPPDTSPANAEGLRSMARQLEAARPLPTPGFRGGLASAVDDEAHRRRIRPRPAALWVIVGGFVAAGSALLAIATAQL